jgi:hypothetical protein
MTLKQSTKLLIPGGMAATFLLSLAFSAVCGTVGSQQTPDPREAMVKALSASGPHPSLGEEGRVFDRFVGAWDCDYTFFAEDGGVKHASGELKFGWVLDGRAVQDIWITYPEDPSKERDIGTSVRFFDPKSKMWRVLFVNPAYGSSITVQGGAEGDRIVLRGVNVEGSMLRWSFNEIKTDSFIWRGEKSRDGGKTWRLREEHHMRRRNGADPTGKSSPGTSASDSRTEMISALRASGPHPSLAAQAQLFDRFVGSWDLDGVFHGEDGKTTRFSGQWIFGWALDGRILQDVLVESRGQERRAMGSTIRFYDAKSEQWRVVWIPPVSGNVIALKGGVMGDRVMLEGLDVDGAKLRWSFNDIQSDSFLWRGETSADGGRTWRVEQEMRLKRRNPIPVLTGEAVTPIKEKSGSATAFERLASLAGEWKGAQEGAEIKVTYTLTANGSALMEEFRPMKMKDHVMITMFTVDGDHLLATHYCSAGNQPQMETKAITRPLSKALQFSLVRVTGMATPDDWHNTGLILTLEDDQRLTQEWSYEYEGKKGTTAFHFTRTQ